MYLMVPVNRISKTFDYDQANYHMFHLTSHFGVEFSEILLPAPVTYAPHMTIKLCKTAIQLILSRDALIATQSCIVGLDGTHLACARENILQLIF